MDTYRNELVRQLVRDGLQRTAAGTAKRGNKKAAGSNGSAVPQLTANQGGHWPMGIRLVANNATFSRSRAGARPQLKIVSSR